MVCGAGARCLDSRCHVHTGCALRYGTCVCISEASHVGIEVLMGLGVRGLVAPRASSTETAVVPKRDHLPAIHNGSFHGSNRRTGYTNNRQQKSSNQVQSLCPRHSFCSMALHALQSAAIHCEKFAALSHEIWAAGLVLPVSLGPESSTELLVNRLPSSCRCCRLLLPLARTNSPTAETSTAEAPNRQTLNPARALNHKTVLKLLKLLQIPEPSRTKNICRQLEGQSPLAGFLMESQIKNLGPQ